MLIRTLLASMAIITTAGAKDMSEGDKCQVGMSYEGDNPTVMIVSQDQKDFDKDDIYIFLANDAWTIKEGDNLGEIKITNTSDGSWLSNDGFASDHSFVVVTKWEHFKNVYDSLAGIHITNKAGKTIDRLTLSYTDFLTFRSCRQKKVDVKAEIDRKEKLRRSIPVDPFAKPSP